MFNEVFWNAFESEVMSSTNVENRAKLLVTSLLPDKYSYRFYDTKAAITLVPEVFL